MVLMLTEDPSKMLQSLYDQAAEGCLLGVSVWGDRSLNQMHTLLADIAEETGVPAPKTRQNCHLFNKADLLAEKIGWKLQFKWNEVSVFPPYLKECLEQYITGATANMSHLSEEQRKWVYEEFKKRVQAHMDVHNPLHFPAQLFVFQK